MKRLSIIAAVSLLLSSCGLLTMISNTTTTVASTLSSIAPNPDNLTPTEDPGTGLCGYLSNYGTWVIPPQYVYAGDFDSNTRLAVVTLQGGRCGAIDVYGNTVIQFNFNNIYDVRSAISSISKGRYTGIELWLVEDRGTGLYGYLDHYGNWHIQPQYLEAASFVSEGYAVVKFGEESWGAIDRSNRVVIQPNFTNRYDAQSALYSLIRR